MDVIRIDESWYARPSHVDRERVSAGGVVVRLDRGNLLVLLVREIESGGRMLDGYVLPKGGVQDGESLEEGAMREVEEETGIRELTLLGKLAMNEHLDALREVWAYNHYFLFLTQQKSGTILDDKHHFDPGWFPIESPPPMCWPDERRLLEERRTECYDLVIAHQNPKKRKKYFM